MKFSQHMKKIISEDRSPTGIIINDKIRVKEYVDERLGANDLFKHRIYAGYSIIETLEACKKRPCVVRLNNGWHKMKFLFEDRGEITVKQLSDWQNTPYPSAEWSYKQIKPGFTVEKMLPARHRLLKFFLFHGKVRYIWEQQYNICTGKIGLESATMHDRNWNKLDDVMWNTAAIVDCPRPHNLQNMINICELLYCNDWKFMRIDLYYIAGEIYLSEMNNYHAGGTNGFSGNFDTVLGEILENKR